MLEQELQKLGLSDKEARVYLASLQLGKSVVQEIAQQSKVNRGTAYNIIESLMGKGLMSSFDQGKKTYFTAESPDRLISLIRIQEEELHTKEDEFSKFLPELRLMYGKADNKPRVKYYEGREGLKAVREEYLKVKSKKIFNLTNLDNLIKADPKIFDDYSPKRIAKGIKSKFLYVSSRGRSESFASNCKRLRESRYVPFNRLPFFSDICILDDKVTFASSTESLSQIIIEDKEIAKSMKAIFDYIWDSAEK